MTTASIVVLAISTIEGIRKEKTPIVLNFKAIRRYRAVLKTIVHKKDAICFL